MSVESEASALAAPTTGRELGLIAAIIVFAAIVPAVLLMAPAVAAQFATQLKLGPVQIGNLFSAELGAMSFATLPAYYWMPRVDWRRAAVCSAVVFIVANLASATVSSYQALLWLRALSALAGGSLMILCLSSAATTRNPDRVYGFWVMGQLVLGAVGLALLPSLFAQFGLAALYVLLALLMAAAGVPLARHFPLGNAAAVPRAAVVKPSQQPAWRIAVCGIVAVLTFYMSLGGVWTFIGGIAGQAAISPQATWQILALATVLGIVGSATASWIGNRISRVLMLLAGYGLMLTAVLLLIGVPGAVRFSIATFLFKFAWTFVLPFILASLAAADNSGRLINTTNLVIGGGLALGPMLAGHLIEASGGGFQTMLFSGLGMAGLSLLLILTLALGQRRGS